ncbi:MAG TPA: hypothetical protein VFY83_17165 [Anaerolineales bacterium]|nr:hypothetical protein [Anaerolineales bacterium]
MSIFEQSGVCVCNAHLAGLTRSSLQAKASGINCLTLPHGLRVVSPMGVPEALSYSMPNRRCFKAVRLIIAGAMIYGDAHCGKARSPHKVALSLYLGASLFKKHAYEIVKTSELNP